ncbi:PEP phosphonomutase-like protein [Polyplosphaeria fusca]|uniref:PEP phosphonomutase-like protein n=1 Tax=Polyplosphaeria fusca TaxID=682080 RepID=A0A9P4UXQ7_9PLEO|nr:PEP phosphonomutase-like protein [Polyplosphaeria fusca]
MATLNALAHTLRVLHKPGQPLLLANVYDAITAKAVGALPSSHALATASWSIAAAAGLDDNDLDLETNLRAVKAIAPVAKQFNKPLTVDFQDGYGMRLEEGVSRLIALGVAGINLEDTNNETGKIYTIEEAAERVRRVMDTAALNGVPEFAVNARTDTLVHDNPLGDAINRGKAFLAAGATNVFVWGGSKRGGLSRPEVEQLTEAFGGKLNVMLKLGPGHLTVKDVGAIGVARCSLGPALQFPAAGAFAKAAEDFLNS